jgi:hypothetical protein
MEQKRWSPCSHFLTRGPIFSQLNPTISSHPTSLRSVLILSSHLYLGTSRGFCQSGFVVTVLYQFLTCPMNAVCPAMILQSSVIMLSEEWHIWRASSGSFSILPLLSEEWHIWRASSRSFSILPLLSPSKVVAGLSPYVSQLQRLISSPDF